MISFWQIFKSWVPRYCISTLYAVVLTSPLIFGGLDMPFGKSGFTEGIIRGFLSALVIMICADLAGTLLFLRSKMYQAIDQWVLAEFPMFTIYRSMSVHWLGFCIPLAIFWAQSYAKIGYKVSSIESIYFIVVALLTSYVHAILEYYFIVVYLEPKVYGSSHIDYERRPKKNSLSAKISRVTMFVGVIPLALMAFTLYLRLVGAKQSNISINELIKQLTIWSLAYVLLAVVIGMLLTRILARDITLGSWRLTEGFQKLAAGDTQHRLTVATADEFEGLANSFNKLVAELEWKDKIYREFGRHVDPKIRDELLAGRVNPTGEQRHGVVMFCDIENFSEMTEQVEPAELITYLNDFFNRIVKTVEDHQGTVNKFLGDAILALWNFPVTVPNAETVALRCAIEIQEAVKFFNTDRQLWREGHIPPLQPIRLGIGLHAGTMVAGTIGSDQRREYSVVGTNVNLAARLQQQTRLVRSNILISTAIQRPYLRQVEPGNDDILLIALGEVVVKGISHPLPIFGAIKKPDDIFESFSS